MRTRAAIAGVAILGATLIAQQAPNPRQQPGATVHIFAPEQHDLYDGHFVISAVASAPGAASVRVREVTSTF